MATCSRRPESPHDELVSAIENVERFSMGLDVLFPVQRLLGWQANSAVEATGGPVRSGLMVATAYAAVFCGLPLLVHAVVPNCTPSFEKGAGLYALQLYGALWAGWSTVTTKIAARSLCRTIRMEIVPQLKDRTSRDIARQLHATFRRGAVLRTSWLVGLASAILAAYLIRHDLLDRTSVGEVVFWSLGWCLLFATSAGVVNVGRFYTAVAAHIANEADSLYVLDPTRSPLLRSVTSLGQRMLVFWFLIAVSIALIVVLEMPSALGLRGSRFIAAEVALAGFFSIGIGTYVFLGSQVAIQRAVRAATDPILRLIEEKTRILALQIGSLDKAGWKQLALLHEWHTKIASSWSVPSKIASGISLFLPFIPLVSTLLGAKSR